MKLNGNLIALMVTISFRHLFHSEMIVFMTGQIHLTHIQGNPYSRTLHLNSRRLARRPEQPF